MFCRDRYSKYIILSLLISWYIFIECMPSINMPEGVGDEIKFGVGTLQFINNLPTYCDVSFLGRHFPLTSDGKHGALDYYFLFPFIFFGGPSLAALRMGAISWGVIILILSYYFCCKFFNPTVGILSVLLLVVNPFFLTATKFGAYFSSEIAIFTLAPLMFFVKWHNTRRNIYFYFGMFLLGLGLNTKGWFIWFIVAVSISALFLYIQQNKTRVKIVVKGTVSLILGLAPMIYYYLRANIYRFISDNIFITQSDGLNNLDILQNLFIRLKHLNSMLIEVIDVQVLMLGSNLKTFPIFFFWVCSTWLLYLIFVRKKTTLSKRKIIFIMVLFWTTFVMSIFSFTALRQGHLFILLPYIQILIAVSIFEMLRETNHPFNKIAVFTLVMFLCVPNIRRCAENYRYLEIERERTVSCSRHIVTAWLLKNEKYNPAVFNATMENYLRFYSNLKINPEVFHYETNNMGIEEQLANSQFISKLKRRIISSNSSDIFIFNFDSDMLEYKIYKTLSTRLKRKIIIRKRFLWPNGKDRFIICSLK